MNSSTIIICQNKDDVPDSASPIVLSEVISQFNEDEILKLKDSLHKLDVDHSYGIPFYTIVAKDVWSGVDSSDRPNRKEILILLHRYLSETISEEVNTIHCIGLHRVYVNLIRDFAESQEIEVDASCTAKVSSPTSSIVINSIKWLFLSVFDAFITILVSPFFSTTDANLLVKYPIFRPETFAKIDATDKFNSDRIFTLLTISYFFKSEVRSVISEGNNIIPVRCFSSIRGLICDYRDVIEIIYDLVVNDKIENNVIEAVEKETGARLERTVGQLTRRAIWSNTSAFLYYGAACELFKNGGYEYTLVTSFGPTGKAVAIPAQKYDVEVYVLPHGCLGHPREQQETLYTGMFREGTIIEAEVDPTEKKLIPTGLPKHVSIYEKRDSVPDKNNIKTVVIGTTPMPGIREEFIRNVVPPIVNQTDWRTVIKIHPQEDISYYHQILSDLGVSFDRNSRIKVVDSNLYHWIGRSHLLLTTRSNVGIESVLLRTPSACYNQWSPRILSPSYAKHGHVPILRESADVVSLLTEWDGDQQRARQERMLDDLYMVRDNSVADIADRILVEMGGSTNHSTYPE